MADELIVDVLVKANYLCIHVIEQPGSIVRGSGAVYFALNGWVIKTDNSPFVDVANRRV